ncbi:glycoside hydrolase family 27 protein [Schizophyllum commune Tattone D]|nr:glycoside hydrolase family 27 protein [Schizophyllum commune Tattone D]
MRDCKESFSMDHGDREKEVAYGSSTPRVSSPGSWLQRPVFQVTLTPAHVGMAMLSFTLAALLAYINLLARPEPTSALDNGVGRLPFMGYNTWNAYVCDINETVIRESADLLVSLGLKDLGYNYMNIDDCYAEKNRTEDGDIIESAERFPSGMLNLTDYIHDLGLKAGIYSDSGWFTCQLYPGSFQNEERDIKLFRETWNFDLLKYDNCAVPFDDIIREGMVGKFTRMADAIAAQAKSSGKDPILFSLCQWGREQPWLWAKRLGQSWRTTDDIGPHWDAISSIINQNSFYTWSSDFYGHGDMDIVRVLSGNGDLTFEEAKSHFTAWALMKSPLLIGTDLSKITKESLCILTNTEIIGINQDSKVGTAITPFRWGKNPDWTNDYTYPAQYWSGESENGTVVMLLNVENEPADMFFTLAESPWIRAGRQYSVRDLWSHTDNGTAVRNLTVTNVPAHGVVALLLKDAGDEPSGLQPPCSIPEWCIDQNGTRVDQ